MNRTEIPWAHYGWSPVTGCDGGCVYCYARRIAERFPAHFGGKDAPFKPTMHPKRLEQPFHVRKGCDNVVFTVPMGDLFDPAIPFDYIAAVFGVMAACPHLKFVVLTKQTGRMVEWLRWMDLAEPRKGECAEGEPSGPSLEAACQLLRQEADNTDAGYSGPIHCKYGPDPDAPWPLPNAYLGFSAENQETFDSRWRDMAGVAAAGWCVWCSLEPMIGVVDCISALRPDSFPTHYVVPGSVPPRRAPIPKLSGIILGAESGPGTRPLDLAWVRQVRDECKSAGVPFSYKQGPGDGTFGQFHSESKGFVDGEIGYCGYGFQREVEWMGRAATVPVLDGETYTATAWEG